MNDAMPISMLKTQAAKDEVANYRRIGLRDDELFFINDGEIELIVINKTGLIKMMKGAPIGRTEALRRMLGCRLVNRNGFSSENSMSMRDIITLDDELELFGDNDS